MNNSMTRNSASKRRDHHDIAVIKNIAHKLWEQHVKVTTAAIGAAVALMLSLSDFHGRLQAAIALAVWIILVLVAISVTIYNRNSCRNINAPSDTQSYIRDNKTTITNKVDRLAKQRLQEINPVSNRTDRKYLWLTIGLIVVLDIIVVGLWFKPGGAIAGGDIPPPYGTAWIHSLFSAWTWTGSNLGSPGTLELQAPWAVILELTHKLNISAAIAEQLWFSILITVGSISAFILIRLLGISNIGAFIGTCFYIFNAHTMTMAGMGWDPAYLACLSLLAGFPAIVIASIKGLIRPGTTVILLACTGPMVGYVYQNPPLVGLILITTLGSVFLARLLAEKQQWKRALPALCMGTVGLLCTSLYWVVPWVVASAQVNTQTISTVSYWAWQEVRATLSNAFWMNTDFSWKYALYRPAFANLYYKLPLNIIRYAPLTLAATALVSPSKNSSTKVRINVRMAGVIAIVLLGIIFLSTGTNAPGSIIFDTLYRLPFGWLLQEPTRFLLLAGLTGGILIGIAVDHHFIPKISEMQRLSSRGMSVVVLCAFCVFPAFPMLTGLFIPTATKSQKLHSAHIHLPADWRTMTSFINTSIHAGAILELPADSFYQATYSWYHGADDVGQALFDRPVLVPTSQGYYATNSAVLNVPNIVTSALLADKWDVATEELESAGTRYILVRGDIATNAVDWHTINPAVIDSHLERDPEVVKVYVTGKLELWKVRTSSRVQGVRPFVTGESINSEEEPELLSLFPKGTSLVDSQPIPGSTAISLIAPGSWKEIGSTVVTEISAPSNREPLVAFPGENNLDAVVLPQYGTREYHFNGYTFTIERVGSTGKHIDRWRLVANLGPSVLPSSASYGLLGPLSNCADQLGSPHMSSQEETVLIGNRPIAGTELSVQGLGSACQNAGFGSLGAAFLTMDIESRTPGAAGVCIWETVADSCGQIAPVPSKETTGPYETGIDLSNMYGGKGNVFVYANGRKGSETSDVFYGNISLRAIELPTYPVVLLKSKSEKLRYVLVENSAQYSNHWALPGASKHVLVDGMRNGWLVRIGSHTDSAVLVAAIEYGPKAWIAAGVLISLVACVLLVILAGCLWLPGRPSYFRKRFQQSRENKP